MWNQTKIGDLFGIRYPILLGPMGGGFSTPGLLAAVSNAGGLGSFGATTLNPEEILEADKVIKSKTSNPYNMNLWVSDVDNSLQDYSNESIEKVKALFKPYFDELSIPLPELDPHIPSRFIKQVEAIFEIKPAVFSFIFGIPSTSILKEARRLNIKTIGAATTLDEALALEEAHVVPLSWVKQAVSTFRFTTHMSRDRFGKVYFSFIHGFRGLQINRSAANPCNTDMQPLMTLQYPGKTDD